MKRAGKRLLSWIGKAVVISLVILFCIIGWDPVRRLFNNVSGEIKIQSAIIRQQLESRKRMEVTSVDEEGVLEAKTNARIFGTVGSTSIRYRYTASIGIDLGKVIMTTDSDRIVFAIPETEVLNDGIEAIEVNKNNFFSWIADKAVNNTVESLLNNQRIKCREQYLNGEQHSARTWEDTVKAFDETVCSWLDPYGERHYQFEFVRLDDTVPAE